MAEMKNRDALISNFHETEKEHATLQISSEEQDQKISSSKSTRKTNKRVKKNDLILTLINFFYNCVCCIFFLETIFFNFKML